MLYIYMDAVHIYACCTYVCMLSLNMHGLHVLCVTDDRTAMFDLARCIAALTPSGTCRLLCGLALPATSNLVDSSLPPSTSMMPSNSDGKMNDR